MDPQELDQKLQNMKVRGLILCYNYWSFLFKLNQSSRRKLIVSIPHPEESECGKKREKKEKLKGYIWVLREEYEPSKKLDKAVFSGKGLKNLGNT